MENRYLNSLILSVSILSFVSCSSNAPTSLIIGKWKANPGNETTWEANFFKDGTMTVMQTFDKSDRSVEDHGTYKFINDEKALALSMSFSNTNSVVQEKESSVLSISKIDSDSLILSGEFGKIYSFFRLKK